MLRNYIVHPVGAGLKQQMVNIDLLNLFNYGRCILNIIIHSFSVKQKPTPLKQSGESKVFQAIRRKLNHCAGPCVGLLLDPLETKNIQENTISDGY